MHFVESLDMVSNGHISRAIRRVQVAKYSAPDGLLML
jgi:hypothetical protein